jgi:hypothetical protein
MFWREDQSIKPANSKDQGVHQPSRGIDLKEGLVREEILRAAVNGIG